MRQVANATKLLGAAEKDKQEKQDLAEFSSVHDFKKKRDTVRRLIKLEVR